MPAKDGDIVVLRAGRGTLTVETAVSGPARVRGLSGRASMKRGHGMFFVFPQESVHEMWMKEMLFPLDVVWLDSQMQVVNINWDCRPCRPGGPCSTYSSGAPARYAIELNAGDAETLGFYEGLAVGVL